MWRDGATLNRIPVWEAPVGASAPAPAAPARAGGGYVRVKRVLDAVLAAAALVLLAPVIACVWIVVLVRLGRPALFRQERVTRGGRRFRLVKFRTMLPVDPDRGRVTDDERLTPFGAWLRATSLDELPSLWNILMGDMSIVGPRPLLPRYLPLYSADQHGRHSVRAGLTGLAQVSGRNDLPWDARLDLDLRYVLLMGPLLDLTIIVRTVTAVLSRDGVGEGGLSTSTEYPGPSWTPRVRFVPRSAATWTALTPADAHIADCALRTRIDAATGDKCAELTIDWIGEGLAREQGLAREEGLARELIADVLTLLVSRARAADCSTARLTLPDARVGAQSRIGREQALSRICREAGFHPVGDAAATTSAPSGRTVLAAHIRCSDDAAPRGAGR